MSPRSAVGPAVKVPGRKRLARASFIGSAVLTVFACWPTAATHAAAAPTFDYSALATAVGIQAQLDSNPEPTPVPDLTDLEVPTSDAQLDSFGTSSAQGEIGNLNGIGKLPGLICLAAGSCDSFPSVGGVGFPPPNPLEADASDPAVPDAVAPSVAGRPATVEGGQAGVATYAAGTAHAHAEPLATHTDARAAAVDLLGAISVGGISTTTDQTAAAAGVTTAATSVVSDIDIGTGLLHIGSVTATTSVTARPGTAPADQSSISIAGVTVAGQPASIDGTGVHVGSASPAAGQLQTVLGSTLKADGLGIATGTTTRTDADDGRHVTVTGLILTLDTPLSGTPPIDVGLPEGVPCPVPGQVNSQLPVDPCSGVGLNLNAAYHGQVVLGSAGVVDDTLVNPLLAGLPVLPLAGAATLAPPGTTSVRATGTAMPEPSATHTGTQVAAGTGGSSGPAATSAPHLSAPAVGSAQAASPPPVVAGAAVPRAPGGQAASVGPLSDIGLGWILGALGLAGLGTLLGRWGVPARLPSRS